MNRLWVLIFSGFLLLALGGCEKGGESAGTEAEGSGGLFGGDAEEVCADCGTVAAITPVTEKGESSGAGAVIGAVVGGLLGNQVGGGSGKDLATAAGAVGGAVAGNEIEKRKNSSTYYEVSVSMDTGGQRTVILTSAEGISVGTPVRVVGNDLHLL